MTAKFVAAYKAGNDEKARALYPVARMPWERIETVAESFGDLDPKIDFGKPILSPVRNGPAGIGWKRTCGRGASRITSSSARPSVQPTATIR
jgi:iron uptake system component EfeO